MKSSCKPMHVAFYMQDLSSGGVERMRLSLISALRARGVKVTLVLGQRNGPLESEVPKDLVIVNLRAHRPLMQIPGLVSFLKTNQPDVMVASLDHNNIAAMIANIATGFSTRLVICQHNAVSSERALGWKYIIVPALYRILHRSAAAVVAVSRGVADDLCTTARLPRRKISVIYNPVIKDDFEQKKNEKVLHRWLVNRDRPVFVFVGRLTAQKDVRTLFLALQRILREHEVRLILVGTGEDEKQLRNMAKRRRIEHAIDFVGFQCNPLPWIKHADALVSSSRYEGLSNVIVEALACGTPVIATDCPYGPAEILLEGSLGTLVPVGDFEALALAMANFKKDEEKRENGLARAANFSASACARSHLKLFEEIIERRSPSVHALGMEFSSLSASEITQKIVGQREVRSAHLMVTPNIDHIRLLQRNAFAEACATASLVCPDGLPVLLYARLRGLQLSERVTGCDIFAQVMSHPSLSTHRVFFVVESHATLLAAKACLAARGLSGQSELACAQLGLGENKEAQIKLVQRICNFSPTILVVTLGAPVSEEFAHRYQHLLPPCWILCVGQALRVHLGLARRAPKFLRLAGLEWLWRLCCEPTRLSGRYMRALLWFPRALWLDFFGRGVGSEMYKGQSV